MTPDDLKSLTTEVQISCALDHPNIVKMTKMYEDKGTYCIVMELMRGGQLLDHINGKKGKLIPEPLIRQLMIPVFSGIEYLHSQQIMHRDLKPENLLLDEKNLQQATLKISDFGLACSFSPDDLRKPQAAGTPCYVAPEIVKGDGCNNACDYWSMGVVLF